MSNAFDLIVVGAGPGGYVAAIRASQLGMNVAIIEKRSTLGGTCLNVGCIPSKALLKSTEHYWQAKHHFSEHGLEVGSIKINLGKMMERKNEVVKKNVGGIDFLMKKNKITRLEGHGKIVNATTVDVAGQSYTAKNILIATGSKPNDLKGVSFDNQRIVSSTEALELQEIPKEMVVIGAGVIGVEMGSVWARLGTKVTVIEFGDVVIPGADKQVQKQLQKSLEEIGMVFQFGTGVTDGSVKGKKVNLKAKTKDGKILEYTTDYCLVAIGRGPYTQGLGLEAVGIELDKRGFITVDKHWQTNVPGIYAIGDVIGGMMLAHKAEDEGVACAEIIAGKPSHINYDAIPSVIYTFPEVASVGKTEEQLKENNIPFNVGKFNFSANGRAIASGEAVGFVKVLAHKETDRILGIHIIGPMASELIAEAGLAMEYFASSEDIGITSHAHPTLSEAVKEAALSALKRSIHGA